MDINIAIDYLGLNANRYKLTQSIPPHSIVSWEGPDTQPTESELQTAYDAAVAEVSWKSLRNHRNQLIAETDWIITMHKEKGTNIPAAWKTYRQALRDLPANTEDPANPVWPTKPE